MNAETKLERVVDGAGGTAYLVGGAIRDELLGLESKDRDYLVTGLPIDPLAEALEAAGFRVDLVGKSFGVLKVTLDGTTFDVALPRTERSTGAGHKDFEVTADPNLGVEADLDRRDFTVNAIAIRLKDGKYVDPAGRGRTDVRDQLIRAVGDPEARFREDPLRMLRAVRFVAKLGFQIERRTYVAIEANAHLINTVAPERIQEELVRLISYGNGAAVQAALKAFRETGLMTAAMGRFHAFGANTGSNTDMLRFAVEQNAPLEARLAGLFLNVPGAWVLMEGLKFSKELISVVENIWANVGLCYEFQSPEAFRRTLARFKSAEAFQAAVHLVRASLRARGVEAESYTAKLVEDATPLLWLCGFGPSKLALSGTEIASWGMRGKAIGEVKEAAAQEVIGGLVPNEGPALAEWARQRYF